MKETVLGNPDKFPVINSLNKIFDEIDDNDKSFKYCTTLIREYRESISKLDDIKDNKFRLFMFKLLSEYYVNNLNKSLMSKSIITHMTNLIQSIYKNERNIL